MRIEYRPNSLLPVMLLAAACVFAGAMATGAILSHYADLSAAAAVRETSAVRARVALLESVLRRQAATVVSLSTMPPTEPTKVEPEPDLVTVPTKPTAAQKRALVKAAIRDTSMTNQLPSPVVAAGSKPAVVKPSPLPSAADALPKPVTPEALAAAKSTNKIEGVSAEKIGVAKIEPGTVVMRSGGRIPVGGRFPSGERLLAVDPATQQIVTDSRTVLIFSD